MNRKPVGRAKRGGPPDYIRPDPLNGVVRDDLEWSGQGCNGGRDCASTCVRDSELLALAWAQSVISVAVGRQRRHDIGLRHDSVGYDRHSDDVDEDRVH
jgi:hypothetical protein